MTSPVAPTTSRKTDIQREIDQARRSGPLKTIVVPPCPQLLIQLREAMASAEPDLSAVARIGSSDVAMSVALMRKANGPLFAGLPPVKTVGQAMTRLGLDATAAVMTTFLAAHAIPVESRHLGRFWEQSAQRAVAMEALARLLPGVSPDLAHTCGLLLHVGLPVMLQSVKGYASTMVEGHARRDRSFVQTENANHRTDHAVVGALVARVWSFAPEVMAAVRLHHDIDALADDRVDAEVRTLISLALVADALLRRREGLPPDAEWQRHGAMALAWLQIDEAELDNWFDTVVQALDDA